MPKTKMKPAEILPLFDKFLSEHDETFEAVIIGGGALSIMGIIPRMTADFDVLDPVIPKIIRGAFGSQDLGFGARRK